MKMDGDEMKYLLEDEDLLFLWETFLITEPQSMRACHEAGCVSTRFCAGFVAFLTNKGYRVPVNYIDVVRRVYGYD